MGLKALLQKTVSVRFKLSRWVNYKQWKHLNDSLWHLMKSSFMPTQIKHSRTFTEVINQFQLNEDDLLARQRIFLRLTQLWLIIFFIIFSYGIYSLFSKAWLGVMPAIGLSMITLCQAFRYHFWRFQLQQKRLGCSFQEWFQANFKK